MDVGFGSLAPPVPLRNSVYLSSANETTPGIALSPCTTGTYIPDQCVQGLRSMQTASKHWCRGPRLPGGGSERQRILHLHKKGSPRNRTRGALRPAFASHRSRVARGNFTPRPSRNRT